MLSALMFSAAILGIPTGAPAPAAARQDDPAIRIWLSDDGRYQRGDRAKVQVKTRDDGYLLVLNVAPDGHLRVLFPLDPADDALIRGGKKYEIIGRGGREAFTIDQRSGTGTVYAAVSRDRFKFEGYVVGDHWDYDALDGVHVSDKPETDLNEFVQRLARSDFDYDILSYDVYENVVRASTTTVYEYNYGPMAYSDWYDGYGCYGYWGCGGSSIFIGIGFGRPHRYFYDPFFYRPYYYYPTYYYPTYYYPGYRYPFYHYPYAHYPYYNYPVGRPPYYGGSYSTPWRPRSGGPAYSGGFEWRAREVPARTPTNGALAAAYRGRFDMERSDRAAVAPMPRPARGSTVATGATPARTRETPGARPTPRRSLDMTPGRTEQARRAGTAISKEPERAPVARRADERPANPVGKPERVGRSASDAGVSRSRVADRPNDAPDRGTPQARGPQTRDRNESDAARVIRSEDRAGYEGVRVIPSRAPEARRADDDRPASRPNIERGEVQSRGARMEPRDNPAPARAEPRAAPPPARAEPRQESRPEPRGGGGNDGWGGSRGGGGSAPAPRGGGDGGGGNRGGDGMGVPTRHR